MSNAGKRTIRALRGVLAAIKSGKPLKQTVVRRMVVKGKTVYTRETFTAPIGKTQ